MYPCQAVLYSARERSVVDMKHPNLGSLNAASIIYLQAAVSAVSDLQASATCATYGQKKGTPAAAEVRHLHRLTSISGAEDFKCNFKCHGNRCISDVYGRIGQRASSGAGFIKFHKAILRLDKSNAIRQFHKNKD